MSINRKSLPVRIMVAMLYPFTGKTTYETYCNLSNFGTFCQLVQLALIIWVVPNHLLLPVIPTWLLLTVLIEFGAYATVEARRLDKKADKKAPTPPDYGRN